MPAHHFAVALVATIVLASCGNAEQHEGNATTANNGSVGDASTSTGNAASNNSTTQNGDTTKVDDGDDIDWIDIILTEDRTQAFIVPRALTYPDRSEKGVDGCYVARTGSDEPEPGPAPVDAGFIMLRSGSLLETLVMNRLARFDPTGKGPMWNIRVLGGQDVGPFSASLEPPPTLPVDFQAYEGEFIAKNLSDETIAVKVGTQRFITYTEVICEIEPGSEFRTESEVIFDELFEVSEFTIFSFRKTDIVVGEDSGAFEARNVLFKLGTAPAERWVQVEYLEDHYPNTPANDDAVLSFDGGTDLADRPTMPATNAGCAPVDEGWTDTLTEPQNAFDMGEVTIRNSGGEQSISPGPTGYPNIHFLSSSLPDALIIDGSPTFSQPLNTLTDNEFGVFVPRTELDYTASSNDTSIRVQWNPSDRWNYNVLFRYEFDGTVEWYECRNGGDRAVWTRAVDPAADIAVTIEAVASEDLYSADETAYRIRSRVRETVEVAAP